MSIRSLIDELDKLVDEAKNRPMSNKILIDKSTITEIITDMRLRLPEEIKESQKILARRDDILNSAKKEAQEILKDAEAQMYKMLEQNEITVMAEKQAQMMMNEAEDFDRRMRAGGNAYVDSLLIELQKTVAEMNKSVNAIYSNTVDAFTASLDDSLRPMHDKLGEFATTIEQNRGSLKTRKK